MSLKKNQIVACKPIERKYIMVDINRVVADSFRSDIAESGKLDDVAMRQLDSLLSTSLPPTVDQIVSLIKNIDQADSIVQD